MDQNASIQNGLIWSGLFKNGYFKMGYFKWIIFSDETKNQSIPWSKFVSFGKIQSCLDFRRMDQQY